MKKRSIIFLLIFLTYFNLSASYAYATETENIVNFTPEELEYINSNQTILIAGNKDLFPIEYYSKYEDRFCGIIPDYFDIISELSGIKFKYIGNTDIVSRLNLAKNKQVDILSAFENDKYNTARYNLRISDTIVILPETEKEICLAYTDIVPSQLISIIQKCLASISPECKESIYLKNSMEYFNKTDSFKTTIVLLSSACLILIIIMFIIGYRLWVNRCYLNNYKNIDEATGYANYNNLKNNYHKYIDINNRINYWIVNLDVGIDDIVDVYGFEESTRLIKAAAEIIYSVVNQDDYFSVIDGKYFVLLLKSSSFELLKDKLFDIENGIMQINQYKNLLKLNISIGICQLKQIDTKLDIPLYNAMQARKYAASNKLIYSVFNKSVGAQILDEVQMEKDLIEGLLNNEFVVYLQPYFNQGDKNMQGCEALVRWNNSKKGLLNPSAFIHILEKKNIIDKLDILVFENVCKILENRKNQGKQLFWISCNFSKQNFLNPDFAKTLLRIAILHNIPTKYLLIEITEGLEIGNTKQNDMIISQLNNYGFPLIIDNFGSGHSSFIDLSKYPIRFVKLDKKIIDNIESQNMFVVTKGLIDIMRTLDIKIMCTGIETNNQAKQVKMMDFDYVQGHFFYHPIYSSEFEKLFDQGKLTIEF